MRGPSQDCRRAIRGLESWTGFQDKKESLRHPSYLGRRKHKKNLLPSSRFNGGDREDSARRVVLKPLAGEIKNS